MMKIINKIFLNPSPRVESFSLPSLSLLATFTLLLVQISSLKAMSIEAMDICEEEERISAPAGKFCQDAGHPLTDEFSKYRDLSSKVKGKEPLKDSVASAKFYRDSCHPMTDDFWKNLDLSEPLKEFIKDMPIITQRIHKSKTNSMEITKQELEKYIKILRCSECDANVTQDPGGIPHHALFSSSDQFIPIHKGYSGNKVWLVSRGGKNLIAVKTFRDIEEGVKELWSLLIVLKEMQPFSQELKFGRVYDAKICPKNTLSIIMEALLGDDGHHVLSTPSAEDFVEAGATWLGKLHARNYLALEEGERKQKFITYLLELYCKLVDDPLTKFKASGRKLLSLSIGDQWSTPESIDSSNIVRLIEKEKQEDFVNVVEKDRGFFREIFYQLLNSKVPALTTATLCDANIGNFIYNSSPNLVDKDGFSIAKNSHRRLGVIDFAALLRTLIGLIGEGSEDRARMKGSFWDWAVQRHSTGPETYDEIRSWEKKFDQYYLYEIKESSIFTKQEWPLFKEGSDGLSNFHKLQLLKAIFNVKKDPDPERDKTIKLTLIDWKLREDAELEAAFPRKMGQVKRNTVSLIPETPPDLFSLDPFFYLIVNENHTKRNAQALAQQRFLDSADKLHREFVKNPIYSPDALIQYSRHLATVCQYIESWKDTLPKGVEYLQSLPWALRILYTILDNSMDLKIQRARGKISKIPLEKNTKLDPSALDRLWTEAIANVRSESPQVHPKSRFAIGYMYEEGIYVKQDLEKARSWYKGAAQKKDMDGQFYLAKMYRALGQYDRASKYIEKATEHKGAPVKDMMYSYLREGSPETRFHDGQQFLGKDNARAMQCFASAASQGHDPAEKALLACAEKGNPEAQFWAGKVYRMREDYDTAKYWFSAAEKQGHGYAKAALVSAPNWHLEDWKRKDQFLWQN